MGGTRAYLEREVENNVGLGEVALRIFERIARVHRARHCYPVLRSVRKNVNTVFISKFLNRTN